MTVRRGNHFHLYIVIVVLATALGFVYGARTSGLFACQAPDFAADRYLGICNVSKYGDYDHGAFWFGLEPTATEAASQATVLFVGNSRMQFALSTAETENWFEAHSLAYYLLGFSHNENHLFLRPLLQRIKPQAKIFVINVDYFFASELTGPANSVMNKPESLNRYKQKFYWQVIHESVCGAFGSLCGNRNSYIRKRSNGTWTFEGEAFLARMDFSGETISYDHSVDQETVDSYADRAIEFLAATTTNTTCVMLTNTPNSGTSAGTARALSERLGLPLLAPELDELVTFDGSHLDPASASRWSGAFLNDLAPHVDACMKKQAG